MNTEAYESLINELLCQSGRTDGRDGSWFEQMACTILVKIGITSFSSLYFIPGSSRFTNKFWDISSLAALSRSIVESYCALRYIAVDSPGQEERFFRQSLWQFQMESEKLRMLEATVPDSLGIPGVRAKRDTFRAKVQTNTFFQSLSDKHQARLLEGKESMSKSKFDLCSNAGINKDLSRGIYKYLSSFTHASPFGLRALYDHKAGSDATIVIVNLMANLTSGFLAFTIRDFAEVFPDQKEHMPKSIVDQIQKWQGIFAWDFSGAGKIINEQRNPLHPAAG